MKFIAYATGTDTVFWSQNTGYMPVRQAALQSQEMKTFYESHPNFKTTVDQLPKTRPQDSARELVPNGDEIIGKGLERINAQNEPADVRVCRRCSILVRGRGDGARFAADPYAPHVMEQMLRTYIDEFRAREASLRPLLPAGARVLESGS